MRSSKENVQWYKLIRKNDGTIWAHAIPNTFKAQLVAVISY